jgi:hypothetical protein
VHLGEVELRPRQEDADGEHDEGNAHEMGGDVAAVAVIGRVLHHQFVGRPERTGHVGVSCWIWRFDGRDS